MKRKYYSVKVTFSKGAPLVQNRYIGRADISDNANLLDWVMAYNTFDNTQTIKSISFTPCKKDND